MNKAKNLNLWSRTSLASALAAFLLIGCESDKKETSEKSSTPAAPAQAEAAKPMTEPAAAPAPAPTPAAAAAPATPAAPAATEAAATALPTIRIKAGTSTPYTNSAGVVWMADTGFDGGDTVERASDMQISNTDDPGLYRTEHYGMSGFSYTLPNGKYVVKLHFAETFEGVSGPGQRVFSFTVQGHEFKDFDVFAKSGGSQHAYIETVPVEVTDGKLNITFTANVENPEINAIEIIPAS